MAGERHVGLIAHRWPTGGHPWRDRILQEARAGGTKMLDRPLHSWQSERVKTRCVVVVLLALIGWTAEALADVMGPSDNVRILFSRNRSVSDVKGGSIGEKLAAFEPSVKITNGSFRDFLGNRACVILMGEDATQKDNWRVICRREFEFDLPASKTHEWVGEPFQQGFDRTMAKSGYDYDGYIILIRNSEGKIVQSAATKAFWVRDLEKAWSLQEGNDYPKLHFR